MTRTITLATGILVAAGLVGCAGSGHTRVSYGVGFGSYYGPSPWHYRAGGPIYVVGGGGPDIPDIPDGPTAAPLPDFGMPDAGGMDDFGDFDF